MGYYNDQLNRLYSDESVPPENIKIKLASEYGNTNYLDITLEQLEEIENILTA
jgi:hypothetical protein